LVSEQATSTTMNKEWCGHLESVETNICQPEYLQAADVLIGYHATPRDRQLNDRYWKE